MTQYLLIPKEEIQDVIRTMVNSYLDKGKSVKVFPKKWLKEEVDRFCRQYKDNLKNGKYRVSAAELENFTNRSFGDLFNRELQQMVKDGEVEMGVDRDGEMTFWLK